MRQRLLTLALCIVALLTGQAAPVHSAPRHTFTNSVGPLPPSSLPSVKPIAQENMAETQEFSVPLRMRDYPKLLERLGRGEVVPQAELERDHLPLVRDYALVERWLREQGFEITETDPNRLNIFARGTLAQIQHSLQVQMVKVTVSGREYRAAQTLPSLPADVAAPVIGVNGLQPFRRPHRHMVQPAPAVGNKPPYLVKEVLGAYGGTSLGVTGSGQTIAILIDSVPRNSDLTSFWSTNGIAQSLSNIQQVNVNNSLPTDTDGEATLDVEWASSTAPGAKVRIYATGQLSFTDIDKALQRIISDLPSQPTLHQLSISLGLGETYLLQSSEMQTEAQYFATIASNGVSIFVASGDAGSNPDDTGHNDPGAPGPLQVEYESSDPSVTGVGGTSLTLNSSGAVSSEVAWSGSGGGLSRYFSRPSWQKGTGVPAGTMRVVPDVALVASDTTAAYLFFNGKAQGVAGTSWSTPTWAGFAALLNEARANHSLASLGLLNPKIYPLLGTTNFRDVTSGSNGSYTATAGYDRVTGLGVPNLAILLQTLSGAGTSAPTIASFDPTSGAPGTTVTITGTNLDRTTAVDFNGTSATFATPAATQLTATVPSAATTGPISVVTPSGTAVSIGSFTVVAAGVANDNFASAQTITGANGSVTGTNVGATKESGEPSHAGNLGGHSIWYRWTAPASGIFTFDTNGSSFDTLLGIYTGAAVGQLTEVVSNDDAGTGVTSSASLTATAGAVYQIAIDGHNGQTGSTTLEWTQNSSAPTINNFVPSSGAAGTVVAINGANFTGATAVQFSGVDAASFSIVSATQITATVPAAAATGVVSVFTPSGNAVSTGVFTVSNPPANDHFAAAQALNGNSGSVSGTNVGATKEPNEPNHAGDTGGHSVWYAWTAASNGPVTFNTFGSSFDTVLAAYTGAALNALTPIASDDQGDGFSSVVSFNAVSGTTYRLAIDGRGGVIGNLSLNWTTNVSAPSISGFTPTSGAPGTQVTINGASLGSATAVSFAGTTASFGIVSDSQIVATVPAGAASGAITVTDLAGSGSSASSFTIGDTASNDDFANAATITGNATVTGTNVGATKETGEPDHAGAQGGASVWWNWTAPAAGQYTVSTLGSSFDTLLAVYTGATVDALTVIASNDDDPNGGSTSQLTFAAVAGTTYRIAVDGFSGATGDIVLSVFQDSAGTLFSTGFEAAEGYTSGNPLAGQNGWRAQGNGANGVVSGYLDGLGQQGYLGHSATSGGASYVWKPVNYTPTAGDIVSFQVTMQIVDSTNRRYDDFAWVVYNQAGQNLFSIHFDNAALEISYALDDSTFQDTGVPFNNDSVYTLLVTMDFVKNVWSASLNGQPIVSAQPISTHGLTRDLGDVDAFWGTGRTPGDNYLLFDNYSLRNTGNAAPKILLQPQSQSVNAGSSVTLRTVATGSQPMTYQWQKDHQNIPGATASSLTLANVQAGDAGAYDVVIVNAAGALTSDPANLTVVVIQAPNLSPYQPKGWSDRLVVSRQSGGTTDDTRLVVTDSLYLSTAIINSGTVTAPAGFHTALYLDGVRLHTWTQDVPLDPNAYATEEGLSLGQLSAGTHQLQVVTDADNDVAESNEGDNSYTKTISIGNVAGAVLISAAAAPAEGGNVAGAGSYRVGAPVDLTATPNAGYGFVTWTLNGKVVSTSSYYHFTATDRRTLVANFLNAPAPTISIAAPATPLLQNNSSLSGIATAGATLTGVTWSNTRGGAGTATGTTAWSVAAIPLAYGDNVITVTAHDLNGTTSSAQVTITRETFTRVHGTYAGLLTTAGATPAYHGRVTITLSTAGSFTSALWFGGSPTVLRGQFLTGATFTKTVARRNLPPLQISLTLNPGATPTISGKISDGTTDLVVQAVPPGYTATLHPWPCVGRYTLSLKRNENDTSAPRGHGYALLTVSAGGAVILTGRTADGAAIAEAASIGADGVLPLYASLYSQTGYLSGPITFSATDPSALAGVADWTRPANSRSEKYPLGFTTRLTLAGDAFTPGTAAVPAFAPGNRAGELGDGDLGTNILPKTVNLVSGISFTITPPGVDKLRLILNQTTGLISGTFIPTGATKPVSLTGVILQKSDEALGFFVGSAADGYLEIGTVGSSTATAPAK